MPKQRASSDLTHTILCEVGPRLRAVRRKRDLTIEALSERTGISASTLSRLEAGKRSPNLELLLPITRALRVSIDDLLMWKAPDPRVRSRTRSHDGYEWFHVLRGRARLVLGEREVTSKKGMPPSSTPVFRTLRRQSRSDSRCT